MDCLVIFSNIVGAFLKWKGIHIYIDAISSLNPDANDFFLVGKKSDIENEYFHKYIEPNKSKVNMTGFINNIAKHLESIDVLVHTSIADDPLPTILLEGMAKGKILIASDVGGVREIIDVSYGNLIIPPGDSTALKEAMETVSYYTIEKIQDIKEKNIQRARERFSLQKQIDEMTKIYTRLCPQ